jgi:hypothetical protein
LVVVVEMLLNVVICSHINPAAGDHAYVTTQIPKVILTGLSTMYLPATFAFCRKGNFTDTIFYDISILANLA